MFEWFTTLQITVALAAGLVLAIFSFAKRKPSLISLGFLTVSEVLLLGQLVLSILLVSGGARAKTDTIEFFGYLLVALMIPVGAAVWALVERNRWSTMVLGVAALTVAIMLGRMSQIWFAN
jgi:hypothetical protein